MSSFLNRVDDVVEEELARQRRGREVASRSRSPTRGAVRVRERSLSPVAERARTRRWQNPRGRAAGASGRNADDDDHGGGDGGGRDGRYDDGEEDDDEEDDDDGLVDDDDEPRSRVRGRAPPAASSSRPPGGRSAPAAAAAAAAAPLLHEGESVEHAPPADDRIPCGMFNWSVPAAEADDPDADDDLKRPWCFMTDYGLPEHEKKTNKFMLQLETFADMYGGEHDDEVICGWIQRHYDDEIYPALPPETRRRWTLTSIRRWVRKRASASAQRAHHMSIIRQRIDDIVDYELYAYNPRTKRRELRDPAADTRLQKWLRLSKQFDSRRG